MIQTTIRFFFVLFVIVLIVGCQSDADDELPSPTAVNTQPATLVSSPTATAVPIPSSTTTEEAMALAQDTATPAQEPAITEESTATPTSTPTETPIPSNPVDSISLVPVVEGAFIKPVYLTHAGDDRLFVVEQDGLIHIIKDGRLLDTPFLDISDIVGSTQNEQGLLGLTFHPDYAQSGLFFVNYTNPAGDTQIARFRVDSNNPDRADPASETVLLSYEQPYPNHNGGQIEFGPDGFLYIGVGDGGSANDPLNNGQSPETILGSILRLDANRTDRSYDIPGTNPFVGDASRLDELWAWGLRNPWRFSFDRLTGDLYIADVGQNLWEEVNFQAAISAGGENYGWNIMEGSHCFNANSCDSSGLELPIFEYSHQVGCSITGGYMYRGTQHPELYGNYFAADYCQGTIWRLFPQNSGEWLSSVVFDSSYIISSFGEGEDGELYILDHVGGSVYHIIP